MKFPCPFSLFFFSEGYRYRQADHLHRRNIPGSFLVLSFSLFFTPPLPPPLDTKKKDLLVRSPYITYGRTEHEINLLVFLDLPALICFAFTYHQSFRPFIRRHTQRQNYLLAGYLTYLPIPFTRPALSETWREPFSLFARLDLPEKTKPSSCLPYY